VEPAGSVLERLLADSPDVTVQMDSTADTADQSGETFAEALARASSALGPEVHGAAAGSDAFEHLVARLRRDELAGGPFEMPEAAEQVEVTPEPPVTVEDPGAPKGLSSVDHVEAPRPVPAAPAPMPLLADGMRAGSGRVVAALSSVAFPTQLLAAAAGRLPVGFGLEEVFGTLPAPRPLPRVVGSLIAVVGTEESALPHARRIAAELGLDEAEIALARTIEGAGVTGRHIRRSLREEEQERREGSLAPDLFVDSPEQAAALSPGWRRDRIGVVAVELPSSIEGAARGRAMLRALRPSVTLLAAEAAWKAADVSYLADGLGGVDALLVDHVEQTMTPAEILSTEIPVRALDGEPADPSCWVRHVEAILDRRTHPEAD
jgi:hypothetical protein